jgi:hypothetical protein
MFVFAIYAGFVWWLVYRFRRRLVGLALTLASAAPPLLVCGVVAWSNRDGADTGLWVVNNLKGYGVVLHILTVPYAAVILLVSSIIFLHHRDRRPQVGCPRCHYDLAGNATGQCPECGYMLTPDVVMAVAETPVEDGGGLTLPSYASHEEAAAAGERSVRRIRLPEHLTHDEGEAVLDPVKHGPSRSRPHAE